MTLDQDFLTMIVSPAKRLDEIKEYYFSQKLREINEMRNDGVEVLNLGIGSPDLPPGKEVIQVLNQHSEDNNNHAYQSYRGIIELRQAFSDWYQKWYHVDLDPNHEILPLIGSKEGLMHIAMTFLQQGDIALVPNPGYPSYRAVSKLAGAQVMEYDLVEQLDWHPDLDELSKQDLSRVKVMWVNYPNMPTGAKANRAFFKKLIEFAKEHRILIINDNPYSFILNEHPSSILSIPGSGDIALELNSLSKSHNMAGWRIGMLAGRKDYLNEVLKFKSNMDSGMFRPMQLAAVKALASPVSWYTELNEIYAARREKVIALLDYLGCQHSENQSGMFIWAKVPAQYADGYEISDKALYSAGVFLTPGGIFGSNGNGYIRLSLCSDISVYDKALEKLKDSGVFQAKKQKA